MDATAVLTLIGVILGGFYWISGKLDKISEVIRSLSTDMRDRVTFDACSRKRAACPCVAQIGAIEEALRKAGLQGAERH